MSETTQLVRYDAMCRAIAEALAVDEVKDIRDKARAIEMYARMAMNKEAERQAIEIRLRAERKCGELIGEQLDRTGRGRPDKVSNDPTLSDVGISRDQSSDWQRLARIPAAEFEADLADRMWRPTTAGMLERQEAREREPIPQLRGDEDALWLWGVLYDFEERGLLRRDPRHLMATPMHDHMRDTFRRLAPLIAEWLGGIE
jgi:hypothetical protein